MSAPDTRYAQMFPPLTDAEIARMRRFGELRAYAAGERLFVAGEPGPGMFVVLQGTGRDHASATASATWCRSSTRARASSWPRSAQLSGRPALVDGDAPRATSRRC